eukprot:Skav231912  [mRNA]  locus=scaffold344:53479:57447:- [translate_table: standard]
MSLFRALRHLCHKETQRQQVHPAPDEASSGFKVVLECNPEEPCGLLVVRAKVSRIWNIGLIVMEVRGGSATSRWNETAMNGQRLEVGHAIMEVNGINEPKEMLREFQRVRRLELLVSPELNRIQISMFKALQDAWLRILHDFFPRERKGISYTIPVLNLQC